MKEVFDIECQICGKNYPKLNKVEVEGSIIEVCDRCVKFGTKVVEVPVYKPITRKIEFGKLEEDEIVEKYGEIIRRSRELKGLTRQEFAKRLNEKESVIKRAEEERMIPDEQLRRKIESFLGIKLSQKYDD